MRLCSSSETARSMLDNLLKLVVVGGMAVLGAVLLGWFGWVESAGVAVGLGALGAVIGAVCGAVIVLLATRRMD